MKGGKIMFFNDSLIHELTKEYVINNFEFKSNSAENLAKFYKKTYSEIESVLKEDISFVYSPEN